MDPYGPMAIGILMFKFQNLLWLGHNKSRETQKNGSKKKKPVTYCWWKKSCTTWNA